MFAIYTFLGRMHGVSEKANPKADKARKPDNQIDHPKPASLPKIFSPSRVGLRIICSVVSH